MGHSKLYFFGNSKHIVRGRLSKDAPHTLFRKYHAALLRAMPIFFLIGINDSLSKDTPCFPWAVGFYFEIAAGLIFASLHPQAHLSPLLFLLLVLAPVQWDLLGTENAGGGRLILCQLQPGPWYITPSGGEIEELPQRADSSCTFLVTPSPFKESSF